MLCSYIGTDQRMYMDYRDAATGRTLEVSPGGQYDIEVISGQTSGLSLPPGDGRWTVTGAHEGVLEVPAPVESPAPWVTVPPVSAAEPEPAASVTSEEAGDSPAEEE